MLVIISAIIFVSIISLYNYFSERNWQSVSSTVRNELVFENRNKNYGAYMLRKNYDRNIMFILAGLMLTFGVAFGAYRIVSSLPVEKVAPPPVDDDTFTTTTPPPDDILPPPPPPPTPPTETTVAFLPPVVTDTPVNDVIPTQEELDKTKAGDKDQLGDPETFELPIIGEEKKPETVEVPIEAPEIFVEEEAEFPGGYVSMMKYIQENFVVPSTDLEIGIQGRITVRFVVEKNGQVSNVSIERGLSADSNKEAIKVVSKMPNWKPGKNGGRAVRQWCTLPINVQVN
jgi:protein TonB